MSGGKRIGSVRAQRGVVLIALMVLLVLSVAWYLVSGLNAATNRTAVNRTDNAEVLAKAKAALIGRMVTDASDSSERNPGRLPCPGDETAENFCILTAETKVGRLPWRTLGLPKLLDASGEPLWYVVSPGWANKSTGDNLLQINSDSKGNLTVDGQPNAAVAVVIAPGGPLVTTGSTACSARTQDRGVTHFCNYLESVLDNNPTAPVIATSGAPGNFNDQVLAITAADLIPHLEAAIAARMQRDLAPLLADAAAAMPGASAAPIYPFAADWAGNLANTMYAGTVGSSQGLLPIPIRSRKACNPDPTVPSTRPLCVTLLEKTLESMYCDEANDEHCDLTSAVSWAVGPGTPTVSQGGTEWKVRWPDGSQIEIDLASGSGAGGIGDVDCTASSASAISCRIWYGRICILPCTLDPLPVTVKTRTTKNAGLAFRRVNPALLDPTVFRPSGGSNRIRLRADGEVRVDTEWLLPGHYPCIGIGRKCADWTIEIPSLYIEDNVPLQARLHDELEGLPRLRWVFTNGWHKLTYFAVSPAQVPGGSGQCVTPLSCLAVQGAATPLDSQQALLALAGRALASTPRGTPPTGYLEGLNVDANLLSFERSPVNKTFNDRIVFLNPRP